MIDFAQARTNMVDSQLRPNGITDSRILQAMQDVSRENFVPEAQRTVAYMDEDVALSGAASPRYLIEPMAFAKMLQAAQIKPTDKVLEIGAATGYGAEILSKLAAQIVAVESDSKLLADARVNLADRVNVSLIEGNLAEGHAKSATYDVIVISGQVEMVAKALFSQLSEEGRLVACIGTAGTGSCQVWTRIGENYTQRSVFNLSVATLPGFGKISSGFAF
jgi:protein-L-isoaspartate(D-aspartate) O-methyltransferase